MSGARFALLTYSLSDNLGDEIQSLAARRWLPRVDRLLDREALDSDPGETRLVTILNGWFMARPDHWPPHPAIAPLITSLHLSDEAPAGWRPWRRSRANIMLNAAGADYLRRHGPIGARDPATLAMLRAHRVDSYHSGCLTLTLERDAAMPRDAGIVACDLEAQALEVLEQRCPRPVTAVTHIVPEPRDPLARLAAAERLLEVYARAEMVVTTRLHCALPCLALGTRVLFMTRWPDHDRLEPARRLTHWCTTDDFVAGRSSYDLAAPPDNPTGFMEFRDALVERCRSAPILNG